MYDDMTEGVTPGGFPSPDVVLPEEDVKIQRDVFLSFFWHLWVDRRQCDPGCDLIGLN